MKNFAIVLAALMCSVAGCAQQYEKISDRTLGENVPLSDFVGERKQLFNFGWKFKLGKGDAGIVASEDYDDSAWRELNLPHDFQFETEWTREGKGARGFKKMCEGWYRKSFDADSSWIGKEVLIDFGGIMYLGDVYLNGKKMASTDYGYVGFEIDITDKIHYDRPNVLAVWASTGPEKGSRWYTGGGLFRDVYLKLQNPTHVARHGLFLSCSEVTRESASVNIQVEVAGWQKKAVKACAKVFAPDGKLVGETEAPMPEHTHLKSVEIKMDGVKLSNPELWSPESPSLYEAEVVLKENGMTVDSVREKFGVRSLEFSPEYGMKLNGEKYWVQGCANHHDMGALGAASYDDGIERMMRKLKKFGFNTIRCSHNPYSESFTEIADRVGMLVVDELIDKWSDKDYWGGREKFTNIWHKLIPEWIKRDRNSPSVIMWSLGNELQIRNDWAGFPETNDYGVTSYRIMDVLVKRFDPTRKTTVAQYPARAGAIAKRDADFKDYLVAPELAKATEVASLNYQSQVYDDYLKEDSTLIIFQSEAEAYKLLAPFFNMPRERTVGLAYWGAVEYWGESSGWPKKGWNYSFFRHTMEPLPQAYLIKSAFMPDEPVVHIGVVNGEAEKVDWNDIEVGRLPLTENWNYEPGSRKSVYAFSNADEVELFYNGKSLGVRRNHRDDKSRRNMMLWENVDYGNGGKLVALAKCGGIETARHEIETTGKPSKLRITEEESVMNADGMSLKYLTVESVDSKGRKVMTDNSKVTISVKGNADILSLDNGNHLTDDLFLPDITTKELYDGTLQVILRSKRDCPGKVSVTAVAGNRKATKEFTSK